jgi:DDB1- and CUL4-associated factor 13
MHPFARARERARALNAAKLDRIFAKPFIDSLEGHADAVEVLVRKPGELSVVASGGWDGGAFGSLLSFFLGRSCSLLSSMRLEGILLHNLALREQWLRFPNAHKGKVSGLCFTRNDQLLSCGVDRNVKLWDVRSPRDETHDESSSHSSVRTRAFTLLWI